MASQGQRFRRKALRRGYKVEEVDAFLDQVEATLAGEAVGPPVTSQEVHDVVFRVRFGGYDEWQVDLHLDRVERQIAELEERGGVAGRAGGPRRPDRPGMPDRMGAGDRLGPPPDRMGSPPDWMGQPMRDDRGRPPVAPPPPSPMSAPASADPYGRYDEPTGAFPGGGYDAPPPRGGYEPQGGPGGPGGYPPRGPGGGFGPGPGPAEDRFDGFEPGRRGKADMTAEIRLPELDRDPRGPGRGPGMGGPPMPPPPMGGPPGAGPGGPPTGGGAHQGAPLLGGPGSELQRVDQIRRTFQVRRFGSGYDPQQVDRLFEDILSGMSGRGPMPVNPAELDTTTFGLVPGGYFEAEVDAALKEVQDILRGR